MQGEGGEATEEVVGQVRALVYYNVHCVFAVSGHTIVWFSESTGAAKHGMVMIKCKFTPEESGSSARCSVEGLECWNSCFEGRPEL